MKTETKIIITDDQTLRQVVREAIAESAPLQSEPNSPSEKPADTRKQIMTRDEILEELQISESTLTAWQKKGIITPRRIGSSRRVYFLREDLDSLLRNQPLISGRSR